MHKVGHEPVSRRVGMKAFQSLAEKWQIPRSDWPVLLGRSSTTTIRNWKENAKKPLDADVAERLSHLVSIYDGLHRLFGDSAYADAWIHEPNRAFGDQSPLERLLNGQFADLYEVRLYIEQALAR